MNMLKKKIMLGAAAGLALALFVSPHALAQNLVMASDNVGSMTNAIGTGFAKLAAEQSSVRVVVRPFSGADGFMPSLNNGSIHLGSLSSITAWYAYNGRGDFKEAHRNLRLVRSGEGGIALTFVVRANSSIRSAADIKGMRVASDFGGNSTSRAVVTGALKASGLSWEQVTAVPVTNLAEAVRAVGDGRADVGWAAFGSPIVLETNAKAALRYVPVPGTTEALKVMREEVFPGMQFVSVPATPAFGVDQEAKFLTYDSYIVAHKDVSADAVRAILSATWEKTQELQQIHRGLRGFAQDMAVTSAPVIPYHEAAIAFFREKGVWSAQAETSDKAIR